MPTGILLRRGAESYDEAYFESLSKSAEEPDNPRGTLGRSSWKEQYQEKGKGDAYQITGLSFSVLYILSLGFISGNAL